MNDTRWPKEREMREDAPEKINQSPHKMNPPCSCFDVVIIIYWNISRVMGRHSFIHLLRTCYLRAIFSRQKIGTADWRILSNNNKWNAHGPRHTAHAHTLGYTHTQTHTWTHVGGEIMGNVEELIFPGAWKLPGSWRREWTSRRRRRGK